MDIVYIGKHIYRGAGIVLKPGQSTAGHNLSEPCKEQMLSDFPLWFEIVAELKAGDAPIPGTEVTTKVVIPEVKSAPAAEDKTPAQEPQAEEPAPKGKPSAKSTK